MIYQTCETCGGKLEKDKVVRTTKPHSCLKCQRAYQKASSQRYRDKHPKKMTWNYRIVKQFDPKLKGLKRTASYSIRDVYYDGNGKPHSWGADPQHPIGETKKGLIFDLKIMRQASRRPVLVVRGNKLFKINEK